MRRTARDPAMTKGDFRAAAQLIALKNGFGLGMMRTIARRLEIDACRRRGRFEQKLTRLPTRFDPSPVEIVVTRELRLARKTVSREVRAMHGLVGWDVG